MPGRILVEIERDGEVVPVTDFFPSETSSEPGVVLDGETSASPRGLGLHIRPLSAAAKLAFGRVQQRHGWVEPRTFRLEAARVGRKLALMGVDPDSLPPGKYEIKVRIGGLKLRPSFPVVRVSRDGDATVRLREKPLRKLRLNRTIEAFDGSSRRILEHPLSRLDEMSAANWLTRARHRDRRKAVLLNVMAKLAAIPSARPAESLSRQVDHVFFAEIDRIYCAVSPRFHRIIADHFRKDATIHPTHRRLLTRIPGGDPDAFDLVSYRERRRKGSLQAVVAVPKRDRRQPHYVDLDIDGANPGMDLVTFFIHIGEILNPDATNHLKLVKRLDRRQIGDFLYYDVVR